MAITEPKEKDGAAGGFKKNPLSSSDQCKKNAVRGMISAILSSISDRLEVRCTENEASIQAVVYGSA
jgi:hypothetical protein